MIYSFKLRNGIRCIVQKIEGIFSVTSGILVGAGSAFELGEENGISHFIEHVNFKGTKKRTAFDISSDIDNLGAQINAFTSKELTCYYVKSIGEHFSSAFEILADLFVDSVYDKTELDKERGVIIEEINMYEDTPDDVCIDGLAGVYFGENGFGRSILGSVENIKAFDLESIVNYKDKYYTTDNIVISLAGAVDVELARNVCEKYLGVLPVSEKSQTPNINTKNLCGNYACEKEIEQAHIALSLPAVSVVDANSDAYSLISGALGGGMSSRLFQTVREQLGLCYSVYSYVSGYQLCGNLTVYAGVSLKKYKDAFEAVLSELDKLKKSGLTNSEFLRTREQMKSSFILSQENSASQMILFGKHLLLTGEIFEFSDKLTKINSLTLEEINSLIKEQFDINSLSTSIVGRGVKPLVT